MTNETNNVMDNQMAPNAPPRSLAERLLEIAEADLLLIQGRGIGTEFSNSFDNAFKNGFKNIAEW